MSPNEAYITAKNNPNADIKKYQEVACGDPYYAYHFAKVIPGADIEKCLNACKDTKWYYKLLKELPQIIAKKLTKRDK